MTDADQFGRLEETGPRDAGREGSAHGHQAHGSQAHEHPAHGAASPERADRDDGSRRKQGGAESNAGRGQPSGEDSQPWHVEGGREPQRQGGDDDKGRRSSPWRYIIPLLLIALLVNWVIVALAPHQSTGVTIPYSAFVAQVDAGNVASVTATGLSVSGTFRQPTRVPIAETGQTGALIVPGGPAASSDRGGAAPATPPRASATPAASATPTATVRQFATQLPAFGTSGLLDRLVTKGVAVTAKPAATGPPLWQTLLLYIGPALLFVGLLVLVMGRARSAMSGAAGGGLSGFGRSRARRYQPTDQTQRTTFTDVAGIEEAKEELSEIVDFLREPDRYRRLGARIPKGVLLTGPPGTGKTLLARAVAGEAEVPFFWLSASEFVEMIVGVGASRVRDLFNQAKQAAPAIVFIDELDAIGRARNSTSSLTGNDEREQTLNQILTEMDGFTGREGVIVLAATNRPEILDQALLRPGRFDRRVAVSPPDQVGRLKILQVHSHDVPLDPTVDLARVASQTPGMVGADLANLINEAALLAAKRRHATVMPGDINDALEGLVLGSERRIVLSDEERRRTAYHESGHALLGMLQPGADPVRKVSIVPRGQALGVTFQSPHTDRYGYDVRYLRGKIVGALGGRAAEELAFSDVTTGAESDLEQITAIARQMVGRWGMSEAIGLVSVLPRDERETLFDGSGPSDDTRRLVDDEVRRIIDECYVRALQLLRENRLRLDALAAALLQRETLDQDEAYRVAGIPPEKAPQRPEPQAAQLGVLPREWMRPPAPVGDDIAGADGPVAIEAVDGADDNGGPLAA